MKTTCHSLAYVIALVAGVAINAPADASCLVAYGVNGRVAVKGDGWNPRNAMPLGMTPSLSPSGSVVAFRRCGNIYLMRRNSRSVERLTHFRPENLGNEVTGPQPAMNPRISWDASGRWIVFDRVLAFQYGKVRKRLDQTAPKSLSEQKAASYVDTIWITDTKTKQTKQIVRPIGDMELLRRTGQLQGAGVYEPLLSPDGHYIWFLNGGNLYEAKLNLGTQSVVSSLRLIARIGDGLEFSKAGIPNGERARSRWHGINAIAVSSSGSDVSGEAESRITDT